MMMDKDITGTRSSDGQALVKRSKFGLLEFSSFRASSGAQFVRIHALSFAL
jgi:hypothetical protein